MTSGVVILHKEAGMTSFAAVSRLKKIFQEKKAGHTGTLDPDATGVLIVCLGKATKLVEYFSDDEKTYEAVLLLGRTTDTEDASGTVLCEKEVTCTAAEARAAVLSFLGTQEQVPPMYSAKKVDGQRLYQLARRGEDVARKAQTIEIKALDILSIDLPRIRFSVRCSKGTYIRTLCKDIGEKLGCGACMERLERTAAGDFSLAAAHTLGALEELASEGKLHEVLLPVDSFFMTMRELRVDGRLAKAVENGNALPAAAASAAEGEDLRVYLPDGRFAAIYTRQGDRLTAKTMFLEAR